MEQSFDDTMTARVAAFQQAKGLTLDGLVGAKTWAAVQETPVPVAMADTTTAFELPEMPVLLELSRCGDEQSLLAFLSTRAGVDIAAILHDLEEELNSQPEVTA